MRDTILYAVSALAHLCVLSILVGGSIVDTHTRPLPLGGGLGVGAGFLAGEGSGGSEPSAVWFQVAAPGAKAENQISAAEPLLCLQTMGIAKQSTDFGRPQDPNPIADLHMTAPQFSQAEEFTVAAAGPGPVVASTSSKARALATVAAGEPAVNQFMIVGSLRRGGFAQPASSLIFDVDISAGGQPGGSGTGSRAFAGTGAGPGEGPGSGKGGGGSGSMPGPGAGNRLPVYPPDAILAHVEGRVLLRVAIRADGTVESVTLEESSGWKSLDESALETVPTWLFIPSRRNGAAMSSVVLVPIRFRINDTLSAP